MFSLKIRKFIFGSVATLLASVSHAATISLLPSDQTVEIGSQLSLELHMDFTGDPTLGGGVDVFYNDSFFDFVSFTFNPLLGDTDTSRRQPDELPGELNGLAFGNDSGFTGPALVGTFLFNVLGPEESLVFTLADNNVPAGGFFSADTFSPQAVTYQGASVTMINAVPVPAAAWLLGSGLGIFGLMLRRRSSPD